MPFIFLLSTFFTSLGEAQVMSLRPASSSGPHLIVDDEIYVTPGFSIVDLEYTFTGWGDAPGNPNLGAVQIAVDSVGFEGVNATPPNPGVDLVPWGYALPNPNGGNRPLGFFVVRDVCSVSQRNCSPGEAPCGPGEGMCTVNPRWVISSCPSTNFVTATVTLDYEGGAVCKTSGGVVDPQDPDRGYVATFRLVVPEAASGSYVVGPVQSLGFSFAVDEEALLIASTHHPATITIVGSLPPDPGLNVSKNRYVTLAPDDSQAGAYRIELVSSVMDPSSVGFVGWVGAPTSESSLGGEVSQVVDTPVFRVWDEVAVHIGDCEIMPGAEYLLSFTTDGVTFDPPVLMRTAGKPQDKDWSDVAGAFNGTTWPAPDGFANVHDLLAVLSTASGNPTAPIGVRANLRFVSTIDPCLNPQVNVGDVFMAVLAIAGQPYPFETNPANCPPCS